MLTIIRRHREQRLERRMHDPRDPACIHHRPRRRLGRHHCRTCNLRAALLHIRKAPR